MEPNFSHAHIVNYAYIEKGQYANAFNDIQAWEPAEDNPWRLATLAYVCARSGQHEQGRDAIKKLQKHYQMQKMDPAPMLYAYLGTDDRDQIFNWFEKAYAEHSTALSSLKVNPAYDPLRSDPRFQELQRRVGLTQ